jgi:hypothetical protein
MGIFHAALADRHGISEQGVSEFSVQNRAAITALREAGAEEHTGMWGANCRFKVGQTESEVEAVDEALDDPNLTTAERIK